MPDMGSDAWPVDGVDVGETIEWDCVWCGRTTAHVVRGEWFPNRDPDDTLETFPLLREGLKFALAECLRCGGPLLVGWQSGVDLNEAEPDLMDCVQLYPPTAGSYPPTPIFVIPPGCPARVRQWLLEADACRFTSSAASVVLTRKAIEGVCADQGFTGNLSRSLRAMLEVGSIDARLWSWSDLLRRVGNEGAHDLDNAVSSEDAEDALWFAGELIHQTYVVQPRFETFSRRRSANADQARLRLVQDDEALGTAEGP